MQRRDVLKGMLAAAAVLAVPIRTARAAPTWIGSPAQGPVPAGLIEQGLVTVDADGRVAVILTKHEMGQGTSTALPQLVAHELRLPVDAVQAIFPDLRPDRSEGTGGSTTMSDVFEPLRRSAAEVRWRLVQAGARASGRPAATLDVREGAVVSADGAYRAPFAALVAAAAALEAPPAEAVVLRPLDTDSPIGRPAPRRHHERIVQGAYRYALDAAVPGQKVAMIERAPSNHAVWVRDDRAAVLRMPGIRGVFTLPGYQVTNPAGFPYPVRTGVAIVGDDTWSVIQARRALAIEWDTSADAEWDDERLRGIAESQAGERGGTLWRVGAPTPPQPGDRVLEADYVYPYQLHQLMEPLNCIAQLREDRAEIWVGAQSNGIIMTAVERWLGVPRANVTLHSYPSGGGFGRRFFPDWVLEALAVSKAAGGVPIKLVWSREDEIRFDLVHLWSHHRYRAVLREGAIVDWYQKVQRTYWGLGEAPWMGYAIPAIEADFQGLQEISPLPSAAWRSVVANPYAFGQECFLDELCQALGEDPVALRRRLLGDGADVDIAHGHTLSRARQLACVDALPALMAAHPPGDGEAVGIAAFPYMHGNCYAAAAAYAAQGPEGPRITRLLIAADVGLVVNPSQVTAQLEGGVAWALTALYHGRARVEGGTIANRNYTDSPLLRQAEMPAVDVTLLDSPLATPAGVGELSPPVALAAAANAISRLTGARVREFPIRRGA